MNVGPTWLYKLKECFNDFAHSDLQTYWWELITFCSIYHNAQKSTGDKKQIRICAFSETDSPTPATDPIAHPTVSCSHQTRIHWVSWRINRASCIAGIHLGTRRGPRIWHSMRPKGNQWVQQMKKWVKRGYEIYVWHCLSVCMTQIKHIKRWIVVNVKLYKCTRFV